MYVHGLEQRKQHGDAVNERIGVEDSDIYTMDEDKGDGVDEDVLYIIGETKPRHKETTEVVS